MKRRYSSRNRDQIAAPEEVSDEETRIVTQWLRRLLDTHQTRRLQSDRSWGKRFDALVARVRSRRPEGVTPEEIEADITAAREEVRQALRAARAKADARGR